MATEVMLQPHYNSASGYPVVHIEDRADAEVLVRILGKNGVKVNLREGSRDNGPRA